MVKEYLLIETEKAYKIFGEETVDYARICGISIDPKAERVFNSVISKLVPLLQLSVDVASGHCNFDEKGSDLFSMKFLNELLTVAVQEVMVDRLEKPVSNETNPTPVVKPDPCGQKAKVQLPYLPPEQANALLDSSAAVLGLSSRLEVKDMAKNQKGSVRLSNQIGWLVKGLNSSDRGIFSKCMKTLLNIKQFALIVGDISMYFWDGTLQTVLDLLQKVE
jgi:hypothetical protein